MRPFSPLSSRTSASHSPPGTVRSPDGSGTKRSAGGSPRIGSSNSAHLGSNRVELEARLYKRLFKRIEDTVLIDRQEAARKEKQRNIEALRENHQANITKDHANALEKWWQLFPSRSEMISLIQHLQRYIVCGRITLRPIFEFINSAIWPNDALTVFPFEDNYSF